LLSPHVTDRRSIRRIIDPLLALDTNLDSLIQLVICGAVLLLTFFTMWSRNALSVGLPACYLLSLAMIHWVGGLIHLTPWFSTGDTYYVLLGVTIYFYAVVAFGAGCLILAPWLLKHMLRLTRVRHTTANFRLPEIYMIAGICFFAVLAPVLRNVPSFSAVSTSGVYLVVIGFCLACWRSWLRESRSKLFFWLAACCALPMVTMVSMGFIGYGAAAASVVFCFVLSFYRPRWQTIAAIAFAFFFGLSAFVTYFRDRNDIRESVWGGEEFSARLSGIANTFRNFEIIDFRNPDHLEMIDGRLNQNFLVGYAVENITTGVVPKAKGATLSMAAMAMIPRILWPNKPVRAGSGNIVSYFTGLQFAEGTSVGVGSIMEFYVNFGIAGVIIGFLIIGCIVRILDRLIAIRLHAGDWEGFMAWFLPSLPLLNTGGSLVEVTAASAAAVVLVLIMGKITKAFAKPRPLGRMPTASGDLRTRDRKHRLAQ
jgi:hypothetical protein